MHVEPDGWLISTMRLENEASHAIGLPPELDLGLPLNLFQIVRVFQLLSRMNASMRRLEIMSTWENQDTESRKNRCV